MQKGPKLVVIISAAGLQDIQLVCPRQNRIFGWRMFSQLLPYLLALHSIIKGDAETFNPTPYENNGHEYETRK